MPNRTAARRLLLQQWHPRSRAERLLVVASSLALGLALDAATNGEWRPIVAGTATLTAVLALLPGLAWLVKPVAAHVGLWLVFNLLRAWADDTIWATWGLGLVGRLEAWLFGGRLPSALLQEWFDGPAPLAWYDYGWTAVYLSFFVVPHLAAALLLWWHRRLFWHYVLATLVLFSLALVGFFALPTSPPWLVTEVVPGRHFTEMLRVTEAVLRQLDLPFRLFSDDAEPVTRLGQVRLEPNPIAAMPSIHFAATVLLVGPAVRAGRFMTSSAIVYTGLMGLALVYLGEHYVLDLLAGGSLAAIGWRLAGWWLGGSEPARPRSRRGDAPGSSPPRLDG
ncbi:MAG: phosphatase PAP2 family protein [Chloroflexota bacterium]|nr:phosphatase PAP2 family protein [Chloroflexota bacterium]